MSGLDPMGRREVRDLIQQLRHEGKTVFFSTHILSDAEALCDRVGVIHQGELRGVGAVAELTSQTQGKVEIIFFAPKSAGGPDEPRSRSARQWRHGKRGIAGRAAGCGAGSAAARAPQTDFADPGAQFAGGILHPETAPFGNTKTGRAKGRPATGRRPQRSEPEGRWAYELAHRLYRLQHFSRGGARPRSVQPDRVCVAAFRGGDSGGRNLDRHRAAGRGEPGADGGVAVRSGDRHLHRHWPGFERDRQTHAIYGACRDRFAAGSSSSASSLGSPERWW